MTVAVGKKARPDIGRCNIGQGEAMSSTIRSVKALIGDYYYDSKSKRHREDDDPIESLHRLRHFFNELENREEESNNPLVKLDSPKSVFYSDRGD